MIYAIAAVAIAASVILAVRLREARTALDQAVAERDSYARLVDIWLRRVLDGDEHAGGAAAVLAIVQPAVPALRVAGAAAVLAGAAPPWRCPGRHAVVLALLLAAWVLSQLGV
jgi:hypothetical protein